MTLWGAPLLHLIYSRMNGHGTSVAGAIFSLHILKRYAPFSSLTTECLVSLYSTLGEWFVERSAKKNHHRRRLLKRVSLHTPSTSIFTDFTRAPTPTNLYLNCFATRLAFLAGKQSPGRPWSAPPTAAHNGIVLERCFATPLAGMLSSAGTVAPLYKLQLYLGGEGSFPGSPGIF